VSESVAVAPKHLRGLINAVLRRLAQAGTPQWPDTATRLSYPDWIVEALCTDIGSDAAVAALEAMNTPAPLHRRGDSYVQDLSSQLVVEAIKARPGELVADLCAAPGGKATALAASGATVAGLDIHLSRCRLMERNRQRVAAESMLVAAGDGRRPPLREGRFDVVLVDAPCSGLGALRRRPDARWRIKQAALPRLAALQTWLLEAAAGLLRLGGRLYYSVCTLTAAETTEVAAAVSDDHRLEPCANLPTVWQPLGCGGMILPSAVTDGMALFTWHRRR